MLRNVVDWLSAADRRTERDELRAKMQRRKEAGGSPRTEDNNRANQLTRSIRFRIGSVAAGIASLIGLGIAGIQQFGREQKNEPDIVHVIPEKREHHAEKFDIAGVPEKKMLFEDEDAVGPEEQERCRTTLRDVLPYILSDPRIREAYLREEITIHPVRNVKASVQSFVRSNAILNARIPRGFMDGWQGNSYVLSFGTKVDVLHHFIIISTKPFQDPADLLATFDHELGHVLRRRNGVPIMSLDEEERETFTGSIGRLQDMRRMIEAERGPSDPMVQSLRQTIIPREMRLLRSYEEKTR